MASTYTAVHKIVLRRGTKDAPKRVSYPAGTEGIELSDAEAKELEARGAVKSEGKKPQTKTSGTSKSGGSAATANSGDSQTGEAGDGLNE